MRYGSHKQEKTYHGLVENFVLTVQVQYTSVLFTAKHSSPRAYLLHSCQVLGQRGWRSSDQGLTAKHARNTFKTRLLAMVSRISIERGYS